MSGQNFREIDTSKEYTSGVFAKINNCYQTVKITSVEGTCPYGHTAGQTFKVTSMNSDGLCGSLYHSIYSFVAANQNGGAVPWEKQQGFFTAACPENGKVHVEVTRVDTDDGKMLRTRPPLKDMTGKGYAVLDRYRVKVEILGVEHHCSWGHRPGQCHEIDHFNIGNLCGCLYWGAYRFMDVLYGGGGLPWEGDANIVHGICPDIYNQCSFRLIREERKPTTQKTAETGE